MLEKFRQAKQAEIASLRERAERGPGFRRFLGDRPSFAAALMERGPCAVIAEYKRASPSKGDINLGLGPADVAGMYAQNGAAAMSVLTEETYFKGELGYLAACYPTGLPLLRKDFLFDPLQVAATAETCASALLLIVRMFDDDRALAEMQAATHAAGLQAVVEVFDAADLARAKAVGARIIQVNNRDLDTLTTDLANAERLMDKGDGEIWISASGMETPDDVRRMADRGYDAVLVGTSIMREPDPGAALARLAQACMK